MARVTIALGAKETKKGSVGFLFFSISPWPATKTLADPDPDLCLAYHLIFR